MQETERFLRYIIPGLIFYIELALYILISGDLCPAKLFNDIKSFEMLFTIFISSGGIGFIFGSLYYTFVWIYSPENFIPLIEYFKQGYIDITEIQINSKTKPFNLLIHLKKRRAYQIVLFLCRSNLDKGANDRIERLGNIVNSLGTIKKASFFSLLAWIFLHFSCFHGNINLLSIICFIISFIVLLIHFANWYLALEDHHMTIQTELLNNNLQKKLKLG
jgi:hypothetical protein